LNIFFWTTWPGMGWVGLGALIAAAGFLFYWHPPSTWATVFARSTAQSQAERNWSFSGDVSTSRLVAEFTPYDDKDNGISDSTESTPKALAEDVAGTNEIPVIFLDGDRGGESTGTMEMSQSSGPVKQSTIAESVVLEAPSSVLMPPPPLPRRRVAQQEPLSQSSSRSNGGQLLVPPRVKSNTQLRPPPSAASTLRIPSNGGLTSSTLVPTRIGENSVASSRRVILEPGHSPLNWAALVANPNTDLRGAGLPPDLIKVAPSILKVHNGRKGRDAWTSYQGKVYNISSYLPFHPGGKGELLRGAGKDAGKLFMETHPWVNWDAILGACLVGILVSENDGLETESNNHLDTMD
jgi:cytochrome b involved in lipid metabolism